MLHIVRTIPYAGWKNCIHITNTVFEAVITSDVGPRIVRYGKVGGPNLLWLDEFTAGQVEETKTWRAYGGHSFDAIVDGEDFLPPENTPLSFELTTDGVNFAPVKYGDITKTVSVRMCRRGGLEIKETITNSSDTKKRVTVKGNTLLRRGGVGAVPLSDGQKPVFGTERPELIEGDRLALVRQELSSEGDFELGFALDELWCGYFNEGSMFVMTSPMQETTYAHGQNLAFGGDTRRIELSSFSPETELAPGESILHTEVWNIFTEMPCPKTEEQAAAMLKNNKYYYEFCKKPVKGLDY